MKYEIKKNFLSPFFFNQIKNIVFSPRFKWEYSDIVAEYSKKDSFYFIHNLFVENSQRSEYFNMIFPILGKLNFNDIIRARVIMFTRRSTHDPDPFHIDFNINNDAYIYNLNTCNGYTLLDSGEKIESIENQIYKFDGKQKHASVAQTDTKIRIIISLNLR
jgi:hypothetical protein